MQMTCTRGWDDNVLSDLLFISRLSTLSTLQLESDILSVLTFQIMALSSLDTEKFSASKTIHNEIGEARKPRLKI